MLKQLLLVGLGGGIGSMFRFLVSMITSRYFQGSFPLATFLVNSVGCFIIGMLMGAFSQQANASPNLKLLLITGFCGGFTTFSAFANENMMLLQQNQLIVAASYTLLSITVGFAAVWMGSTFFN